MVRRSWKKHLKDGKIVYERYSVFDHSSSDYRVEDEHGVNISDWGPNTLNALFRELHPGMYQEGKGTWFSMRYTIIRPGRFHVEYNYDEDPHILFSTAWGYTNDLKYFPRADEHIPDWLRQKLTEEQSELARQWDHPNYTARFLQMEWTRIH